MEITKKHIDASIASYPMSKLSKFYMSKIFFKVNSILIIMLLFMFLSGFFLTAWSAASKFIAIPTYAFTLMMILLGILHIYSWYHVKRNTKKRARFLGISSEQYLKAEHTQDEGYI